MDRFICLGFILFLLQFAFVSADACDDFCVNTSYAYGACRETLEKEGFCEGEDEMVYGFSFCKDFERCCCGGEPSLATALEVDASEEMKNSFGENARTMFGILFFIVVLLGLILLVRKKAFREDIKQEEP